MELAEEQSKIDSELGKSHDASVKAGTEGGKLWAEMDEADRYRAALRSANALATGAGVFEVTGADGKKITISADDVIYLSNGEFGKVGYGPMATMGTSSRTGRSPAFSDPTARSSVRASPARTR